MSSSLSMKAGHQEVSKSCIFLLRSRSGPPGPGQRQTRAGELRVGHGRGEKASPAVRKVATGALAALEG